MPGEETPLVFGPGLVGILHHAPAERPLRTGVVVVVGGPSYRVGSHRQFLRLARSLAAAGHPVLRFDCAGMGDSPGAPCHFGAIGPDIAAAVDCLHTEVPGIPGLVLWGLCDGATAAVLACSRGVPDPRVRGLVLLNPWARTEEGEARALVSQHYRSQLLSGAFWRRLLSGGVDLRSSISGLVAVLRRARGDAAGQSATAGTGLLDGRPLPEQLADALLAWRQPLLLVLSGNDLTATEFEREVLAQPAVADAVAERDWQVHRVADADHTFATPVWETAVQDATVGFLAGLPGGTP